MPRILSVWLDRWPIRRFLQAQSRKPAAEPVDPARPFVLAVDASGGPKVAALNEAARAEGIAEADAAALRRLALWATRYTPAAGAWNEDDGADGLFLDIAGASHLFGGEAALIADLRRRLAGFGLPARLALAEAPGAGWALARYAGAADIRVPSGGERAAVERLPIEALRLDPGDALFAPPSRPEARRRSSRQAARPFEPPLWLGPSPAPRSDPRPHSRADRFRRRPAALRDG